MYVLRIFAHLQDQKPQVTNYNLKMCKTKLEEEWSESVWLSDKMKQKKEMMLERACR